MSPGILSFFRLMFSACALAALAAGPAQAQTFERVAECRAIDVDADRLACFDERTAPALVAATHDEASRAPAPGTPQSAATKAADAFGASDLRATRKDRDKEPNELRANMTTFAFTRSGRYVMTLDNGQIWRQIRGDSDRLNMMDEDATDVPIIIKKGLLGSHRLRLESSKRTIRVERIQ